MFLDAVNVDVNQLVNQLQAIGTPIVQETLKAYIQQQIVSGAIGLGVSALFVILGIVGAIVGTKNYKKWFSSRKKDRYDSDLVSGTWAWVGVVTAFLSFCFALLIAVFALNAILNPEYWAIKDLLSIIHQ